MNTLLELLQKVRPDITTPLLPHLSWADQGLDSMDLAELAARIEQHYQLEIPDNVWQKLANLEQLAGYLRDRGGGS
ncbi:MAG TPA: phosphopantetheine-binding protein [Polyangiaceae bacterium]|nr:phosphopantetheine-binding protein [Polyangiaceae bacterium]